MSGHTLFSIGEALIDMIPTKSGCSFVEVPAFSPRVGGAPANVCGAFTALGGHSALLTQLGDDPFGHKIADELAGHGIDVSRVSLPTRPTPLWPLSPWAPTATGPSASTAIPPPTCSTAPSRLTRPGLTMLSPFTSAACPWWKAP